MNIDLNKIAAFKLSLKVEAREEFGEWEHLMTVENVKGNNIEDLISKLVAAVGDIKPKDYLELSPQKQEG